MIEECLARLIEQLVSSRIVERSIFTDAFEADIVLCLDVGENVLENVRSFGLLDNDGEFAELEVVSVPAL